MLFFVVVGPSDHQEQDVNKQQEVLAAFSWPSENQEDPEPPQIKEEPRSSQDGDDELDMKPERDNFRLISVCQESYNTDNHPLNSSPGENQNHFEESDCDNDAFLHRTNADECQLDKKTEHGESGSNVEAEMKQRLDKTNNHGMWLVIRT